MLYISQLPPHLQTLALERQASAGNSANMNLLVGINARQGGFDWDATPEGYDFWYHVAKGQFQRAEEFLPVHQEPAPVVTDLVETVGDVPKTSAPSKANASKTTRKSKKTALKNEDEKVVKTAP